VSRPATELPFIDEHALAIAAGREQVWSALNRYVTATLRGAERSPLTRLLGTEPRAGFEIARSTPLVDLDLAGRHRFSRYLLAFELSDGPGGGTVLRARSFAVFPGPHGRVYRLLVIGTRFHVLATKRILGSVERLALRDDAAAA
jgi:hypothetical protein